MKKHNCPNCGAPIDRSQMSERCPYCGTTLEWIPVANIKFEATPLKTTTYSKEFFLDGDWSDVIDKDKQVKRFKESFLADMHKKLLKSIRVKYYAWPDKKYLMMRMTITEWNGDE